MDKIRVMVIDDHPAFRFGIRTLLETSGDMTVVAEAQNGLEALSLLEECDPHVVLLDIQMPGPDGVSMVSRLLKLRPEIRIVMLTASDNSESVVDSFAAGASAFLTKNEASDRIVEVVRRVHAGERVVDGAQTNALLDGLSALKNENQAARIGLTDREIELLRHLADGESYADIAAAIYISQSTIKRMLEGILVKLNAANKVQAVAEAYKRGLI